MNRVLLIACIAAVPAFGQEPSGSDESRFRDIIEQSCLPGEEWSDPVMLLWLLEHPPDSAGVPGDRLRYLPGIGLREPDIIVPAFPDSLHKGSVRVPTKALLRRSGVPVAAVRFYRGWTAAGGEPAMSSSAMLSIHPARAVLAEIRWVESRESSGIRRSLGGGVEVRGLGIADGAVLGDYRYTVAEGLVFGCGPTTGGSVLRLRSPDHMGVAIPGLLRGYTGAIVRLHVPTPLGVTDLTACYSRTGRDRSRISPVLVEGDEQSGGSEADLYGGVTAGGTECLYGARVRCSGVSGFALGLSGLCCSVEPDENAVWDRGARIRIAALDLAITTELCSFSLELSRQSPGIAAGSTSVELRIGKSLRIASGGRAFGAGYWNPHTSGINEDGDARSERNMWAGCALDVLPWLNIDATTTGTRKTSFAAICPVRVASTRSAVRAELAPSEGVRLALGVSVSRGDRVVTGADPLGRKRTIVRDWGAKTFRLDVRMALHHRLDCSVSLAGTGIDNPMNGQNETGVLLGVGCRWNPVPVLQLDLRWTVFGTDSYETRLYQGEQMIPGRARFVMVYGEGDRTGVWLRIIPAHAVRITAAATRTVWRSGTGPAGTIRSEYAVQVDVRM